MTSYSRTRSRIGRIVSEESVVPKWRQSPLQFVPVNYAAQVTGVPSLMSDIVNCTDSISFLGLTVPRQFLEIRNDVGQIIQSFDFEGLNEWLADESKATLEGCTQKAWDIFVDSVTLRDKVHNLAQVAETMQDNPTSRYKTRSNRGEVIVSDMRKVKTDFTAGKFVTSGRNKPKGYLFIRAVKHSYSRYYLSVSDVRDPLDTSDNIQWSFGLDRVHLAESPNIDDVSYQNALSDAYGAMMDADFDVLVAAAELNKTIETIVRAGKGIAEIAKAIRKGKFFKYARKTYRRWKAGGYGDPSTVSANVFSDAWLEARYAWRPLMYDAVGAFKWLKSDHRPRATHRGYSESTDVSPLVKVPISSTHPDAKVTFSGYNRVFTTVRAGILAEADVTSTNLHDAGLYNLSSAVWDLTPFSFVVGWFVNVNYLLWQLNPHGIYKPLGSWVTITQVSELVGQLESPLVPDGSTRLVSVTTTTKRIKAPKPELLSIDVNIDVFKLVDLVLILRQLLR